MPDNVFTEPDDPDEEWVDVRMSDPQESEWDVDAVVVGGQVEYVDLRIRPELLDGFVGCLLDDVSEERAEALLRTVAERQGVDLGERPADD
ncbi:hypothetical protein G9464_11035 [Halostella sp. JP-L12]|uniref:hypothetical protein n=1 Tax=Halostella TaxID=1843185 RepID=UPI000EF817DF|nr:MULTISPECIES: hypothetical protein [Halostella]NHN48131.1 hypothetical protein [Halostella sp. JP-L12]